MADRLIQDLQGLAREALKRAFPAAGAHSRAWLAATAACCQALDVLLEGEPPAPPPVRDKEAQAWLRVLATVRENALAEATEGKGDLWGSTHHVLWRAWRRLRSECGPEGLPAGPKGP